MTELLFVTIGVMLGVFLIVGGVFWAWGFITSSFDAAFARFEEDTASPFTFSLPDRDARRDIGWTPEDINGPERLRFDER